MVPGLVLGGGMGLLLSRYLVLLFLMNSIISEM